MNPVDMEEISRKKKKRKMNQQQDGDDDRISCLPEALIHHILSFLQIYDVIRTSLLSRRWRHIWRTTPVLDFGVLRLSRKDPSIIGIALMLYEGRKVRRLSFEVSRVSESHLDSWIRFATRRDVEELDLVFDNQVDNEDTYQMPHYLLECEALRVLKLEFCDLNLVQSLHFHMLKELRLGFVTITKLDVSGCPPLECLIMDRCRNCIKIHAPNKKLRYLEITDYDNYHDLTVYAPNLPLVRLIGYFEMVYKLENLSSIESASLEHRFTDYRVPNSVQPESQNLMELLKSLSNAKTLKLSQSAIMILSYGEWNGVKPLHLSATCLKLEIDFKNYEFHVVTFLLKSCPCLETLVISSSDDDYDYDEDISLESFETALSTKLFELALSTNLRLKTLLIHMNYRPEKLEMAIKLIKLLLKCCKMLNKMVISFDQPPLRAEWTSELLLGLTMKLLAFPRASVNAEIHISSSGF